MPHTKEGERIYRETHREKCRATYFIADQKKKKKNMVLIYYSPTYPPSCAYCGITDQEVLCIDHIHNDGKEQRKITGFGSRFYQWLITNNFPKGYQVLCFNCNHKKEVLRRRSLHV